MEKLAQPQQPIRFGQEPATVDATWMLCIKQAHRQQLFKTEHLERFQSEHGMSDNLRAAELPSKAEAHSTRKLVLSTRAEPLVIKHLCFPDELNLQSLGTCAF